MTEFETIYNRVGNIYRNKCIDGKVAGISLCVGYCKYCEHQGFLTEHQRKEHDCISKGCRYYVQKERTNAASRPAVQFDENLTKQISSRFNVFEGMKIMRIIELGKNLWKINYITISNDYPIEEISKSLEKETGYKFVWNNLNYDYEICAKIIFA